MLQWDLEREFHFMLVPGIQLDMSPCLWLKLLLNVNQSASACAICLCDVLTMNINYHEFLFCESHWNGCQLNKFIIILALSLCQNQQIAATQVLLGISAWDTPFSYDRFCYLREELNGRSSLVLLTRTILFAPLLYLVIGDACSAPFC